MLYIYTIHVQNKMVYQPSFETCKSDDKQRKNCADHWGKCIERIKEGNDAKKLSLHRWGNELAVLVYICPMKSSSGASGRSGWPAASSEWAHETRKQKIKMAAELPPFRSLQDFITEARFSAPTMNDPERLANRVVSNLLYYQTNYFFCSIILFLLVA